MLYQHWSGNGYLLRYLFAPLDPVFKKYTAPVDGLRLNTILTIGRHWLSINILYYGQDVRNYCCHKVGK